MKPKSPFTKMPAKDPAKAESLEDYLMDLRGYRVLPNVLASEEVRELTDWLDQHGSDSEKTLPPVGTWIGDVELHSYYTAPDGSNPSGVDDGMNFQHIYEAGEPFERLLDHPSWYQHAATLEARC